MALVHQATCPTCGQVHMVTGMRSVYAGPVVEVCGECVVREAKRSVENAHLAAYRAACERFAYAGSHVNDVMKEAAFKVLLRRVCKGRTEVETLRNIESFWNEVRKEVES